MAIYMYDDENIEFKFSRLRRHLRGKFTLFDPDTTNLEVTILLIDKKVLAGGDSPTGFQQRAHVTLQKTPHQQKVVEMLTGSG